MVAPLGMETNARYRLADLQNWPVAEIDRLYAELNYDYADEALGRQTSETLDRRRSFIRRVDFSREPTSMEVRRFFNQLNTHFAEQLALETVGSSDPVDFLFSVNRLLLFGQQKRVGLREREGVFGVRDWLPIHDPRRSVKLFRGVEPESLMAVLNRWGIAINCLPRTQRMAVLAVILLIAIHPFADANGRAARVMFSWITARWFDEPLWLAEDANGEFARTGSGGYGTTYFMAEAVREVAKGKNLIPYSITPGLGTLDPISPAIIDSIEAAENDRLPDAITQLHDHLLESEHIRSESTRFHALRGLVRE